MKNSLMFLVLIAGLFCFVCFVQDSHAQSQGLEGTGWQGIHPGETYSPILDRSIRRQFFCKFTGPEKVNCDVVVKALSKIKYEQVYDRLERKSKFEPKLLHETTLPQENRVGVYRQIGNKVVIDLSAYKIEATIDNDSMTGEITFRLESSQKARWIAKRLSVDNKSSSVSTIHPNIPANTTNKVKNASDYYWEALNLHNQKKYTEALEKYTESIAKGGGFGNLAYLGRGDVKFDLKNYQGAIADYDQGLQNMEPFISSWLEIIKKEKDVSSASGGNVTLEEFEAVQSGRERPITSNEAERLLISSWMAYCLRRESKKFLGDQSGARKDFLLACDLGKRSGYITSCNDQEKVCRN